MLKSIGLALVLYKNSHISADKKVAVFNYVVKKALSLAILKCVLHHFARQRRRQHF